MFGARNLAQLLGHGKSFGCRGLRLIRKNHLRFSFALSLDRGLQRQASFVLFGDVLHRGVFRFFGLRGRATLQGENHLTHLDLRAFFDLDFLDRAGHGRRNFHHGLVGFQFHHRLAFGNLRAGRNHQAAPGHPDRCSLRVPAA